MSEQESKRPRGAPIDKFLKVAKMLDGKLIVTPELFNRLIGVAADLEGIEAEASRLLTDKTDKGGSK